jgi:hypothetical protein
MENILIRNFDTTGELITFFRAPPRVVRNVFRGLTETSSPPAEDQQQQAESQQQQPRLLQSPALVSDAVRRLGLSAQDREVKPLDPLRPENSANILRAMTNLLTVSRHKVRRDSDSRPLGEMSKNYSRFPRRSIVFMNDTTNIAGGDRKVALDYEFQGDSLSAVCETNAIAAREHRRYDHERVFRTLRTLFRAPGDDGDEDRSSIEDLNSFASETLARGVITRL